jgi:hypothetical protein
MVEFHSSHGGRAISYGRPTQRGTVRSDALPILIGSLVVGGVVAAAGTIAVNAVIPAGSTGTAITTSATRIPTIRQVWTAKAWITRPVGNVLKHPVYSPLSTTGQRVAAHAYRAKSLYGYGMLGMALMNPLENINYARKGQYDRLGVNIAAPLIGIPLYDAYLDSLDSHKTPHVPPERVVSSPITGTLPKKFRSYDRKSPATSSKSGGKSRTKSLTKRSKYTSKRRRGARAGKKYCKKHSKYDYCHRWKR